MKLSKRLFIIIIICLRFFWENEAELSRVYHTVHAAFALL